MTRTTKLNFFPSHFLMHEIGHRDLVRSKMPELLTGTVYILYTYCIMNITEVKFTLNMQHWYCSLWLPSSTWIRPHPGNAAG